MAKIIEQRIGWPDSTSPDVVGYTVYYTVDTGAVLTYDDASVDVGMPVIQTVNGTDFRVVSLTDVVAELQETTYRFGVAARDERGNESAIREIVVEVDVTAPEPVPFVQEV